MLMQVALHFLSWVFSKRCSMHSVRFPLTFTIKPWLKGAPCTTHHAPIVVERRNKMLMERIRAFPSLEFTTSSSGLTIFRNRILSIWLLRYFINVACLASIWNFSHLSIEQIPTLIYVLISLHLNVSKRTQTTQVKTETSYKRQQSTHIGNHKNIWKSWK